MLWCTAPERLGTPLWTYAGWYTAWFTGIRGSTRYKFPFNGITSVYASSMWAYDEPYDTRFAIGSLPVLNNNVSAVSSSLGHEVVVPAASMVKYYQPRWQPDISVNQDKCSRRDIIALQAVATFNATSTLFVAAGPDITATRFRRTPGFRFA